MYLINSTYNAKSSLPPDFHVLTRHFRSHPNWQSGIFHKRKANEHERISHLKDVCINEHRYVCREQNRSTLIVVDERRSKRTQFDLYGGSFKALC